MRLTSLHTLTHIEKDTNMKPITKRFTFFIVGAIALACIDSLNHYASFMLGAFAWGWMLMVIAQTIWPDD